MKKASVFMCLLLVAVLPAVARNRIAVFDFTVESSNSAYEHIGKGLSTLLTLELGKSPGVNVVKRRKYGEVLAARKLSLDDLRAPKVRTLLSEMLAADYLVSGTIEDYEQAVTVRLWMSSGTSGEIIWEEEITESLELYEYISAVFAASILSYLEARVTAATIQNATFKISRKKEALIEFSAAIDYLDRADREQARTALSRAAAIDPYAEGIIDYLERLEWPSEVVSARFRIEPELYTAACNPAALGFLEEGQFYFLFSNSGYNDPDTTGTYQAVDGYFAAEDNFTQVMGCLLPLAPGLGLGVEWMPTGGGYTRYVETPFTFDFEGAPKTSIDGDPRCGGGSVSLGYALTDNLSLGTSLLLWQTNIEPGPESIIFDSGMNFAVQAGFLLRLFDQRLTCGLSATCTDLEERYLDFDALKVEKGALPLLLEASLAAGLLHNTLIASLKVLADVYIDGRDGYVLRVIPVLEYRLLKKLLFRFGGEYSRLQQAGESAAGCGLLGGASVRFGSFEVDVNYSVREKPSRLLPGYTLSNRTLFIGAYVKPFSEGLKRSRVK